MENTEKPLSSSDNIESQEPADILASESEDSGSHLLLSSEAITDLADEDEVVKEEKLVKDEGISALDKLLGQLGIYATWLSSIAYLQKQLRIFIFFYATFFFCDYTFSYCLKSSGMCLHIYSLPSSAFLKYQTSGFYCT